MKSTRKYSKKTLDKIAKLYREFGPTKAAAAAGIPRTTVHEWARAHKWKRDAPADIVPDKLEKHAEDMSRLVYERDTARTDATKWRKLHQVATRRLGELVALEQTPLNEPSASHKISPRIPNRREAAVVLVASDWHVEEEVVSEHINERNEYNLDISKERADRFFAGSARIMEILGRDVEIKTVVLALLGDFITNDLHHDSAESNLLPPTEATIYARELIVSGIEFLLANTGCDLVLPCHSGNHGRTTKRVHNAYEHGRSLEYMMYRSMEAQYAKNERVKFLISSSYHSYLSLLGTEIRFHHGHGMRYAGGVGGLYIPVGQAIKVWNRTRHADLDVFGHFHQQRDGGHFLSNGSLIGYNAYALRQRYEFESPRQTLFLVDSKFGRTVTWPILVG